MTSVIGESWCWNGQSWSLPTCPKVTFAREFRYDGGRQRYLDRSLNACDFQNGIITPPADGTKWTDYDGDEPYGDFTWSGSALAPVRSFELGVGRVDPWTDGSLGVGESNTAYYHADMLGTTRMMTNSSGASINAPVFTAFGEKVAGTVDGSSNRYGYVGAHGYQAHDDMPFLHLGARYYDPSSGRFLQRDPIGIDGGVNVYAYANAVPTAGIDANGTSTPPRFDDSGNPNYGSSPPTPRPSPAPRPDPGLPPVPPFPGKAWAQWAIDLVRWHRNVAACYPPPDRSPPTIGPLFIVVNPREGT